ncbi:hypothetical protein DHEL01_v209649 [Diaporthe helianthi]|uniref:Rhodopsin domain-containing protein n=1 Tax=Diaporthe helianthi TaxID=158607 RepID=A0A2P5HP03_DIAHE|nr:hypothetical protein DHEL01_v209649 [Diaporthe helianthi]
MPPANMHSPVTRLVEASSEVGVSCLSSSDATAAEADVAALQLARKLYPTWTASSFSALMLRSTRSSLVVSCKDAARKMHSTITATLLLTVPPTVFAFTPQSMNKISILLFLLRVFQQNALNRAIWATTGLCLAYALSFFATLFQCSPINHAWLQLEEWHHGHCNNIHLQGWMSAIFNIIIDLIILALPLHAL